jgi:ADP-ribosylglycohydrolase
MTAVQGTEVGAGLQRARSLGGVRPEIAAELLGNGARVTCQDTVPFCLWVAAWCLHDYPGAVAACVDGAGDVDTTCAIAGGVVGAFTGRGRRDGVLGIPLSWIEQREPLPTTVHRASLDTAGDA